MKTGERGMSASLRGFIRRPRLSSLVKPSVDVLAVIPPYTSSSRPFTPHRPLSTPFTALEALQNAPRPNLSVPERVNEGKKVLEEQTQVMITSSGEEVEEGRLEARSISRRVRGSVQPKVNNDPSYLKGSRSRGQVRGAEQSFSHHLSRHLSRRLPHRLPRTAPELHNITLALPSSAPSGYGDATDKGRSSHYPTSSSATEPSDAHVINEAPDGGLTTSEIPLHHGIDEWQAFDYAYHPYHPGDFPYGDFGEEGHDDFDFTGSSAVHDPFYPDEGAAEDFAAEGYEEFPEDYDPEECHNGLCPNLGPSDRPSSPGLHPLEEMRPGVGIEHHGGGFGEVVGDRVVPHQQPDNDEFFHVNEVTVSPVKRVCGGNLSKNYRDVRCFPEPDAFNPCEDIMGNLVLRLAVWVVVVTAVFGNLSVMVVLMSTRFKMTVSKFLMCNLAVADLFMGIYLLIIAAMDLHTIGVYFNSAIYWQNGPGCKVAGFLTVFASELSILTLTVITLERWYAITYAIHLNKRLRLSVAARVMVLAWLYSLTMAALPLLGVSGYSKTSICLPMETADGADQAYLLILLITNGLAFVLICVCYAKMYCSIAGNNLAANTSDTTVAKRMALLVFTDFACWAPIAFFGLTAVCGYPLISVTHAKFLLVFFYPLNSCANPYLYAILTKQYRRDLFLMLARHGFCTRRAMKYKGGCSTNTWLNHHHVCVSGGPGGGGSGSGPSRRISTLTQITTCGEWRARGRDGSEESLPRQSSPGRVRSISAELTVPTPTSLGGGDRRMSDVWRRLHPVAEVQDGRVSPKTAGGTATSGSPHPIKNCYARMSFTPEQEALLLRYASDRQPAVTPTHARRRSSTTDARDDVMPLSLYTPTTPETITTPISPSLDHSV